MGEAATKGREAGVVAEGVASGVGEVRVETRVWLLGDFGTGISNRVHHRWLLLLVMDGKLTEGLICTFQKV